MGFRDAAPDGRKDREGHPILVLSPGASLKGRYLVSYLGIGGMSIVYKGYCEGRTCFIKEVEADNSQHVNSLLQEKLMLEKLDHPGIVKVHDFFEEEGFYYLVTDFIEGKSLNRLISPLPDIFINEKIVVDWARQLYDIFEYLHSLHPPVIYRDLKPQNIIRDNNGNIHLVDFGIARNYKEGVTMDTTPMGSFITASPEHYGGGQTDERSDIYTLGATLHYLLTNGKGRGTDLFDFSPPRNINSRISVKTENVIMTALSHEPRNRFATIGEMKQAHLNGISVEGRKVTPVMADYSETVKLTSGERFLTGGIKRPEPAGAENLQHSLIYSLISRPLLFASLLAVLIIAALTAVALKGPGTSKKVIMASSEAVSSPKPTRSTLACRSSEPSVDVSSSPLIPEPGFRIVLGSSPPAIVPGNSTPAIVPGSSPPAIMPTPTIETKEPVTAETSSEQSGYPTKTVAPRVVYTKNPELPMPTEVKIGQQTQAAQKKEDILAQLFHYKIANIRPAPRTYTRLGVYRVAVPDGYYTVTDEENKVIFANFEEKTGSDSLRVLIIDTNKFDYNKFNDAEKAIGTYKMCLINSGATVNEEGIVSRPGFEDKNYCGYFIHYKGFAPSPLGTRFDKNFLYKNYYIPNSKVAKILTFTTTAPEGTYAAYKDREFQSFLDSIEILVP